ncbi:MAG TPA: hypothetical protein VHL80_12705 [Polyangia bacterium]|nr:hypothetical protein [Polyangia bacterium]
MTPARGTFIGLLAGLAGAASAAGCGGGSPDACGKVAPCGGDLVGTWTLTSTCATRPALPAKVCDGATIAHSSFDVSGSATFGADHTFGISATESGTIEVSVPAACLGAGSPTDACTQLTPAVPPGTGARCVASGDGCLCTFIVAPHDVAETGTYAASGSSIDASPAGGLIDGASYCVAGERLHLVSLDSSAAGAPSVIGDLVGAKY